MSTEEVVRTPTVRRSRLAIVIATVGALLVLLAIVGAKLLLGAETVDELGVPHLEDADRGDTPERYAELAGLLSRPLYRVGEVPDDLSLAEGLAVYRMGLARLRTSAAECRDMSRFARARLKVFLDTEALQQEMPAFSELFRGVAYAALGIAVQSGDLMESGGKKTIDGVADTGSYVFKLKSLQVEAQANAIEFARECPKQFAGPVAAKPYVGVQFLPPAGLFSMRTNTEDMVVLENRSGQALNDCLVLVRLKGESGETFTNIHFVAEWAPAEKRYATYESGPFGCTVSDPSSVTVCAWARQASSPPVTITAGPFGW